MRKPLRKKGLFYFRLMIIPPFLMHGDKVGIVATAKKVDEELLKKGLEIITGWGLEIILGKHVYDGTKFLAGADKDRLADLEEMISRPDVKAIFCARGGYGTGRIIEDVDFEPLIRIPKWIIGFSDITILHLKLSQLGLSSIHSPMPAIFHKTEPEVIDKLQNFLFDRNFGPLITAKQNNKNRQGLIDGVMTGGNLAMVCSSLRTSIEIDTNGKILFLEDVDEPLYKIDRMLHQLKAVGKLSNIKGLVIGHFSLADGDEDFDFGIEDIVMNLVYEFKYPVAFDFPVGHEPDNYPLPLNFPVRLTVNESGSSIQLEDETGDQPRNNY